MEYLLYFLLIFIHFYRCHIHIRLDDCLVRALTLATADVLRSSQLFRIGFAYRLYTVEYTWHPFIQ